MESPIIACGSAASSHFAPCGLTAGGIFGKKHKTTAAPSLDGAPVVPITSGLGATGDIYQDLGWKGGSYGGDQVQTRADRDLLSCRAGNDDSWPQHQELQDFEFWKGYL